MSNLKGLLVLAAVMGAVLAINALLGGGLFAIFSSGWKAPKSGDVGSQAICVESCSCREDEHCVDGTCRKWGCVLSPVGRGGCPQYSKCDRIDGVPVCVRLPSDPKCQ
jgi:hypothetical protein